MTIPLRVLLVAYSPEDARLLEQDLERRGYDPRTTCVTTNAEYSEALNGQEWDIVVCGGTQPPLAWTEPLEILRASLCDVPFVLLSDDAHVVAEAATRGVADCVAEHNRSHLVASIDRLVTQASASRLSADAPPLPSPPTTSSPSGPSAAAEHDGEAEPTADAGVPPAPNETDYLTRVLTALAQPAAKAEHGDTSSSRGPQYTKQVAEDLAHFNRQVVHTAQAGIVVYDTTLRHRVWNPYMERVTGLPASAVLGRRPDEMFPYAVKTGMVDNLKRALAGEVPPPMDIAFFIPQTGAEGWATVECSPLRDPAGRIVGVLRTSSNITARKRAAAEWRKFKTIADGASYGVVVMDLNGRISYANRRMVESQGYAPEEVIGHSYLDFFGASQRDGTQSAFNQAIMTGDVPLVEIEPKKKDGSTYPALASGTLVCDEEGHPLFVAATIMDISERRRLEEQLRQAQKIEAVGQLAGGVAHDFNNMLSVILGYADLLLAEPKISPASMRESLVQIQKAAERARQVTSQLLAFSRKQVLETRVADLNQIIADFSKMLQRLIGEDIAVVTKLCPDLWPVLADVTQMGQVLINLAVNARDAMSGGGSFTIETANCTESGTISGLPAGSYVRLTVSDTGCGMDPETQSRMFEPFFTTKGLGKGTGLGLATVYGIVKQHGGEIVAQSAPGRGTTFSVYLPKYVGEAPAVPARTAPTTIHGGSETILVTEDEDAVRSLVCRLLGHQGYRVLAAKNGMQALRLAADNEDVRLLVTDLVMPEMNGRELWEQVRAIRPQARVIFMSGYAEEVLQQKGMERSGIVLMRKPFSLTNLVSNVRAVLASQPPSF